MDPVRVLCLYAILAALALGPAILTTLAIRYVKGLALRWILPALVIGLLAAPGLLMAPDLSMADRSASPDAGSFVIVGMVMLMGLVVISALIGGAVGVFLRHRQKQSEAVRMFWTPR